MRVTTSIAAFAVAALYLFAPNTAQTYSSCNPLIESGCPADTALGKSETIDFTSGASSQFTPSGEPTYSSNGAGFTIARSGDSPLIQSDFYIMFGHVEYTIQAAPGTGIVSSAIMQSDCLDEIDLEWLGGDDTQVQSNYFGKGITTTYNRGAYHSAPNNHDGFHTYSIDWTAAQIVWQVDGVTVRVLTYADAATGQYPQTPMVIKVGAWSGGDPSNPAGTIEWAGGETDYSAGPFTMYLKSIQVSDYSTGRSYSYVGTTGTWQSIVSNGGNIGSTGEDTPSNTVASPSVTSASSDSAPVGGFGYLQTTTTYTTPSIWPWVASATESILTTTGFAVVTSISGLPSGWTINSSGRVVPPSGASSIQISGILSALSASLIFGGWLVGL
jgi:hypothetical protein